MCPGCHQQSSHCPSLVSGAPQHSPGLSPCARLGHRDAHPSLERAGTAPTPEHPTAPGGSPLPISLGAGFPCSRDSQPFSKRSHLGALVHPPVLHVEVRMGHRSCILQAQALCSRSPASTGLLPGRIKTFFSWTSSSSRLQPRPFPGCCHIQSLLLSEPCPRMGLTLP